MSDPKDTSPDALSQPGDDSGIALNENQLNDVSGGATDTFAKIGDIKGESPDIWHK
jgi:hypothetical protein